MSFGITHLIGFGSRRAAGGAGATASYNAVANWSGSKYLSRTPSSNGSARKGTLSLWCKRSATGALNAFGAQDTSGSGNVFFPLFTAGNALGLYINGGGTTHASSGAYTSTTTWYHIVFAIDTDQGTGDNRNRMYVNGVEVSYADANNYASGTDIKMNQTTNTFRIGNNTAQSFSGKMAHLHWIDGAQLTPGDFSQAGVSGTVPKAYAGSFGTNGFLLDFANSSDIGNDVSGLGNDVTVTGLVSGDVSAETVTY